MTRLSSKCSAPSHHSCTPNCAYRIIGDFLLEYTTRAIEPGEELCHPYLDVHAPFRERAERLATWIVGQGFVCDCRRCCCCRASPALVALEEEVHAACLQCPKEVDLSSSSKAHALGAVALLDRVMPAARR